MPQRTDIHKVLIIGSVLTLRLVQMEQCLLQLLKMEKFSKHGQI